MNSEGKKRQRAICFSGEEKLLIANTCAKYKHILENKTSDHISSEEKNKTWEIIASKINAASLNATFRSADVLKRFYENWKIEVRKIAAEEKKEIFATGGEQPKKFKKDACHDVFLSILNSKTVYGLENNFDGDVEPLPNLKDSNSKDTHPEEKCQPHNEVEIVYESDTDEQGEASWKKYIPANLKQPTTFNLISFKDHLTPDPRPGPSSSNFEDHLPEPRSGPSSSKFRDHLPPDPRPEASSPKIKSYDEETKDTPQSKKRNLLSSSRRRPTIQVKALTRSELAEKYDQLLDRRLELIEHQKKKIEEERSAIEREGKLKAELLELQIEVEKEKLKQLRK